MVVGCQPYAPAAFTPRKYSWYSFLLEAESTPGPWCYRKDFMSMKNPFTPAGIEPATLQCVAQHFNHCATVVPRTERYLMIIWSEFHPAVPTRLPQMAANVMKYFRSLKNTVVFVCIPVPSLPLKSDSYSRGKESFSYNTKSFNTVFTKVIIKPYRKWVPYSLDIA